MIEIQNIPIPRSPEQKKFFRSIRDIFIKDLLRKKIFVQMDFSAIEMRVAAMCDPIYALRRLKKKKGCVHPPNCTSCNWCDFKKEKLCDCPRDVVLYQGCKCGGK